MERNIRERKPDQDKLREMRHVNKENLKQIASFLGWVV